MQAIYHKMHLPNYGVFDEERYFRAGTSAAGADASAARASGITICEDIWYPQRPGRGRGAGRRRADRQHLTPRPTTRASGRARADAATRAADNLAAVAYCNLVGGQDELVFDGSQPDLRAGRRRASPAARQFEEDLVVADLDLSTSSACACAIRAGGRSARR